MNYYNEWDPQAAAWLRELIKQGHIPKGYVDERSITDVKPGDLDGFVQCHFFAGIGGWPLALRMAGISEETPLWTGSPPCQPFSAAGKQLGQFDPRHLAPVFLNLISECRPSILFGEQVAPAIAKSWMCDLQTHLEGEDYAVGFAVLPACGIGAPHKRERLFFGAVGGMAIPDSDSDRGAQRRGYGAPESAEAVNGAGVTESGESCGNGADVRSVADADNTRPQRRQRVRERADEQSIGSGSVEGGMANPGDGAGLSSQSRATERGLPQGAEKDAAIWPNPDNSFWTDADWLGCRDGKFRPVEPGTFPLANGVPARVGRLRGYGNAIVPQVAAEFIKAFTGAINEI